MLLLHILSSDVKQVGLLGRIVDHLFLHHRRVLARLLLRRRVVILQLLSRRTIVLHPRDAAAPIRRQQHLCILLGAQFGVQQVRVAPAAAVLVDLHDALVAFLAGHQLGNHGAILLVNSRLVGIGAANGARLVVTVVLLARDFRQLEVVVVTAVLVRTHLALHVVVGQHRVVQGHAALRGVALALVFVVIHAVYVYDSLVILA